jgi:hypothetical protein
VCPTGGDVIGAPFLDNRKAFVEDVVRPLQEKVETVYVIAGSDAEGHVTRRFPQKHVKRVGNSLKPTSIQAFLDGLPLLFQRGQAADLAATFHFRFFGSERADATVIVCGAQLDVQPGLQGRGRLASDRGYRNVAGLSREAAQFGLGAADGENPFMGISSLAFGFCSLFSGLKVALPSICSADASAAFFRWDSIMVTFGFDRERRWLKQSMNGAGFGGQLSTLRSI